MMGKIMREKRGEKKIIKMVMIGEEIIVGKEQEEEGAKGIERRGN